MNVKFLAVILMALMGQPCCFSASDFGHTALLLYNASMMQPLAH